MAGEQEFPALSSKGKSDQVLGEREDIKYGLGAEDVDLKVLSMQDIFLKEKGKDANANVHLMEMKSHTGGQPDFEKKLNLKKTFVPLKDNVEEVKETKAAQKPSSKPGTPSGKRTPSKKEQ